jgi:hypothetical protein
MKALSTLSKRLANCLGSAPDEGGEVVGFQTQPVRWMRLKSRLFDAVGSVNFDFAHWTLAATRLDEPGQTAADTP